MGRLFAFDMDDTFFDTDPHYSNAQQQFLDLVLENIDIDKSFSKLILKRSSERQFQLIDKVGFDREIFPQSLRYTYFNIACENGIDNESAKNGSHLAYKIGRSVFDKNNWAKVNLYPGVEDTLDYLVENGNELRMITLGDPSIQKEKIDFYGLNKWFTKDNVDVVLKEKTFAMQKLVSNYDPNNICFIGNSYKSDIKPALGAGIIPIWIPQNTWGYDKVSGRRNSKVIQLENISQIRDIYDSLVGCRP